MREILLTVLVLFPLFGAAQTASCTVVVSNKLAFFQKHYAREIGPFLSLTLNVNHVLVTPSDTTPTVIPIHSVGFDTIHYTYTDLHGVPQQGVVLCAFQDGEVYTLSPCTCCGYFMLRPAQKAARGFVQFDNRSKAAYLAQVSAYEYDDVAPLTKTAFIFSSISMNCGFRPHQIFIADEAYSDAKYRYPFPSGITPEEKAALKKERQSHLHYEFEYLFLQGERLVVTIDPAGQQFDLQRAVP